MNVDPAIIGITLQSVTQGASAFTQYVPKLTDIRKADPNDSAMIGDVRLGEIAAVSVTISIGVIASALTNNPVPAIAAAVICLALLFLYESALRGQNILEPATPVAIPEGY